MKPATIGLAVLAWLLLVAPSTTAALERPVGGPGALPSSAAAVVASERGSPADRWSVERAQAFAKALLARDLGALQRYLPASNDYLSAETLDPDLDAFLYNPGAGSGARSITAIAGRGPLGAVIVPQSQDSVFVLYAPRTDLHRLDDEEFLQSQWMIKYFACEFSVSGQEWTLIGFCFMDSGGPYPDEED